MRILLLDEQHQITLSFQTSEGVLGPTKVRNNCEAYTLLLCLSLAPYILAYRYKHYADGCASLLFQASHHFHSVHYFLCPEIDF